MSHLHYQFLFQLRDTKIIESFEKKRRNGFWNQWATQLPFESCIHDRLDDEIKNLLACLPLMKNTKKHRNKLHHHYCYIIISCSKWESLDVLAVAVTSNNDFAWCLWNSVLMSEKERFWTTHYTQKKLNNSSTTKKYIAITTNVIFEASVYHSIINFRFIKLW